MSDDDSPTPTILTTKDLSFIEPGTAQNIAGSSSPATRAKASSRRKPRSAIKQELASRIVAVEDRQRSHDDRLQRVEEQQRSASGEVARTQAFVAGVSKALGASAKHVDRSAVTAPLPPSPTLDAARARPASERGKAEDPRIQYAPSDDGTAPVRGTSHESVVPRRGRSNSDRRLTYALAGALAVAAGGIALLVAMRLGHIGHRSEKIVRRPPAIQRSTPMPPVPAPAPVKSPKTESQVAESPTLPAPGLAAPRSRTSGRTSRPYDPNTEHRRFLPTIEPIEPRFYAHPTDSRPAAEFVSMAQEGSFVATPCDAVRTLFTLARAHELGVLEPPLSEDFAMRLHAQLQRYNLACLARFVVRPRDL